MPHRSARSRYLLPLVLQVWFAPTFVSISDPGLPWWTFVVDGAVAAVLLAFAARNVGRLWRAPESEAGWRSTMAYTVVGALLSLVGTSITLDSVRWDSRVGGLLLLLFGVAVLALAAREGRRTAARHRVPA